MEKLHKTEQEWRTLLTPEQYRIMRAQGTEPAFSCPTGMPHEGGVYHCAACDLPLFRADAKFESGTGWPSYYQPVNPENIEAREDTTHGMQRTEVRCSRCDSHLGHVFDDGPKSTGKRYCISFMALRFVPDKI